MTTIDKNKIPDSDRRIQSSIYKDMGPVSSYAWQGYNWETRNMLQSDANYLLNVTEHCTVLRIYTVQPNAMKRKWL